MGIGAASAIIMLIMIASIIMPYLYSELAHGAPLMSAPVQDTAVRTDIWSRVAHLCSADPASPSTTCCRSM